MRAGRTGDTRKSLLVLEHLVTALLEGQFPVGTRLPPERELCEVTGVSRTSVREALAVLTMEGIVERRHGSGTYTKSVQRELLSRALSLLDNSDDPEEIFEWQQLIEPSVAKLAARKATIADFDRIAAALDAMRKAVTNHNRPAYSRSDRRFHLAVAEACGNSIVTDQMTQLFLLMSRKEWRRLKAYGILSEQELDYLKRSLAFHERVVAAIRDRDYERIDREFADHYTLVHEVVFEGKAGSP